MRRILSHALLAATMVAAAGCDFFTTFLPGRSGETTPNVIVVREGSTAQLPDGRAEVRFLEKLEESRCPRGVDCVRAGEARVHLALVQDRADSVDFRLTIPGFVDASTPNGHESVVVGDYTFTLLELSPYPDARAETQPVESVATLRVAVNVAGE